MNASGRVVVTGMGVVSPLGNTVEAFWSSLLAGRSGIGPLTRFDASALRCRIAGEVKDFDITAYLPEKEARRFDRFCHYALVASLQAVRQSGLSATSADPERIGVIVSSGVGGLESMQENTRVLLERGVGRLSPLTVPIMIPDMASGMLSIQFGFQGPNLAVVTACASATHSIGEAYWMIRRGDADAMLAGGTEAGLVALGLGGFASMRALSTRNDDPEHASRPFDRDRDGFVPAEGAGVLVLESLEQAQTRGAEILAELVGYGLTGDAYHITAPDPEGRGAARSVRQALARAGVAPEEVGYINAHGTSTPLNDRMETVALKAALGSAAYRIPVSSTKSMTGHALGAAGGFESIACIQALRYGVIPGTMNYQTPDPECDLDYVPNACREVPVRLALNVSFGFGGHNAALLFKKAS
jgi:3-oxoacyl-[acyl-carrier-protein] synthase II